MNCYKTLLFYYIKVHTVHLHNHRSRYTTINTLLRRDVKNKFLTSLFDGAAGFGGGNFLVLLLDT